LANQKEYQKPLAEPRSSKSDSAEMFEALYFGTVEQSFKESAYHPDSFKNPYNPDTLVEKDFTYGVYEEMLQDDQIDVALNLKKDLIVGSGWVISYDDENIKTELEGILQDEMERPLSEVLRDMIQAYDYGFSVSEKLFKKLPDGKLALRNIKTRHPSTWLLGTDEYGNIEDYVQQGVGQRTPTSRKTQFGGDVIIPREAIIHYINNQRHQNPYGNSDLKSAYQAWLTKKHVTRFYAIFLENAAGAKPVAKYDRKAPQAAVNTLYNAIKKLQTKTALVMPKDFDVEFLEANANGGDSYIKGINLFNMIIGRALFIPDIMGFVGSETGGGSFALGKEQVGLFYKHIFRRREILERIIDQHIIRPLCLWNYGLKDNYPKFKFNPLSTDDARLDADLWIKGIQGANWQPTLEEVNHFKDIINFPTSEEVEFVERQQAPSSFFSVPEFAEDAPKHTKDIKKDAPKHTKDHSFELAIDSLGGDFHKKTDFRKVESLMESQVNKIRTETSPILEDMFEDLFTQLHKKKVIQKQDITRVDNLKLKGLKQIQSILKRHFRRTFEDSSQLAKTEVKKSDFNAESLFTDEFLEFLENETFQFVGDFEFRIKQKTRIELIKAIKDGLPLSNVISTLDKDGRALTEQSLERYARTKTTEVFNRGRRDYFDSTGVVAAYQYSAILDGRTSDICRNLHGRVFEKDKAPTPPLHFNCRSVLIPITRFEEHKIDRRTNDGKNIDSFLKKEVTDKGFSVFENFDAPKETKETEVNKSKENRPQISDHDVSFQTECLSDKQEKVIYSKNGNVFQETYIYYEDSTKTKIKAIDPKRVD